MMIMSHRPVFFLLGLLGLLLHPLVRCLGHSSKTSCEVVELDGGVGIEVDVAQPVTPLCGLLAGDINLIRTTKSGNHCELP